MKRMRMLRKREIWKLNRHGYVNMVFNVEVDFSKGYEWRKYISIG